MENKNAAYFGSNLKYLRKKAKVTQTEIAKRLNLGDTTISNYESGVSKPEFDTLIELANLFEVSIDNLLFSNLIEENRIFSRSENEKPPMKTTNDTTNVTKTELSLGVSENQVQHQRMSGTYKQEVASLKSEVAMLKERLRDKEDVISALKTTIQAQNTTIESLTPIKAPSVPLLEGAAAPL